MKLLFLLRASMTSVSKPLRLAVFPNRVLRIGRTVSKVKLIIFRNLIKLIDNFTGLGKMNSIAYWGML
jgi:hypothetical protein